MGNHLTPIVRERIRPFDDILDVCCGNGVVMDEIVTQGRCVGVDIFEPDIRAYAAKRPDLEFICGDALAVCREFPSNSFSTVVCLDGIEHLKQADAEALIMEMERIAQRLLIVVTPESTNEHEIGVNLPHNTWDIEGGGELQRHLSGFRREYFSARGYEVQFLNTHPNSFDGSSYNELVYYRYFRSALAPLRC